MCSLKVKKTVSIIELLDEESRKSRWRQRERKSENFFTCWWGWASILRLDERFEFRPCNRFRSLSMLLPIKSERSSRSTRKDRFYTLGYCQPEESAVPFSTSKAFYILIYFHFNTDSLSVHPIAINPHFLGRLQDSRGHRRFSFFIRIYPLEFTSSLMKIVRTIVASVILA